MYANTQKLNDPVRAVANSIRPVKKGINQSEQISDNRPESVKQMRLKKVANSNNSSTAQLITGPQIKGYLKYLFAKACSCCQLLTSSYRLKNDSKTAFMRKEMGHDEKREFYKTAHSPEEMEEFEAQKLIAEGRENTNEYPDDIIIHTRAQVREPANIDDPGRISVIGRFENEALQERVTGKDDNLNELDGEIYAGGPDRTSLVVNTLYSYPIGMSVGSILNYEAFYQAVRIGKDTVREGMGEGQAAKFWQDKREGLTGEPQEPDEETALLDTPQINTVSAKDALIGSWVSLSKNWEKR